MIMPLSLFGLKFLEWWYSSERSDVVRQVTSLPVPPPPGRVKVCCCIVNHCVTHTLSLICSITQSFTHSAAIYLHPLITLVHIYIYALCYVLIFHKRFVPGFTHYCLYTLNHNLFFFSQPHPQGIQFPTDPTVCPLCLNTRRNPTAIACSGSVAELGCT